MSVHKTFIKIAITPETHLLTERTPRAFTRDPQLLRQSEAWGIDQTTFDKEIKKVAVEPPESINGNLLNIVEATQPHPEYISIGLTLFYLDLIGEKNCQKFIQKMLFLYSYYEADVPENWPRAEVMAAMAKGTGVPKNFTQRKLAFLFELFQTCFKEILQKSHECRTLKYFELKLDDKRDADLNDKILKNISLNKQVIGQGGISHFLNFELASGLFSEDNPQLIRNNNTVATALFEKKFRILGFILLNL